MKKTAKAEAFLLFLLLALGLAFGPELLADSQQAGLPFEDLLDLAVQKSTQLGVETASVDASEARLRQAWGTLGPSLALDANKVSTSPSLDPIITPSRQLTLDGTINIFRFGADTLGIMAATRSLSAERKRREALELQVEADASTSLLGVIEAHETLKLQEDRSKSRKTSLEIAQRRYDSGLLSQEEVDRIAIDLANSEAALRDSEIQEIKARSDSEALFGVNEIPPEPGWQWRWPWKDSLPRKLDPGNESLRLDLERIPGWKAAQEDVDSSEASASQGTRGYLPSLDAKGSYGYQESAGVGAVGWSAELVLSFPLFSQLQTSADVSLRDATSAQAAQRLDQMERDARARWRAARKVYETSIQTAWDRENAVSKSAELYERDLEAFRQGLRSANDLTLDQGRLFDSRTTAIQGWKAAHLAFIDLCHSVGSRVRDCRKRLGAQ